MAKAQPAKENRQIFLAMIITERDQVSTGDFKQKQNEGNRDTPSWPILIGYL